jgi:signal transduction histidine kinase
MAEADLLLQESGRADTSRIPFRKRLSVRQTQIAVAIALLIGMLFAGTQIAFDASRQRENLTTHAQSVLDYANLPAARAAYRIDRVSTQELTDSLLNDPAIVRAEITDDFSERLAVSIRDTEPVRSRVAGYLLGSEDVRFERDLYVNDGSTYVGKILIDLDPVAAAPGFAERFYGAILSGLLKSTLLSIMLLLIFHSMVTKRVNRLASSVSVSPDMARMEASADELDHLEARFRNWTDQLTKTADEARKANDAKSVFLAGMSHEMRTPLNAIIGYAELLEYGIGISDEAKRAEYLRYIIHSGRQLNVLLGDILDFSKIEAGKIDLKFTAVSPADIVIDNLPVLKQIASEAGLALETRMPCNDKVMVDADRLRQVLFNFVSNAAKYNQTGSRIEITCVRKENGNLRFSVLDDGIGIMDDQIEEIFQHFLRGRHANPDIPGAGLGLAISRQLVEAMGGSIGCESSPGKGAMFWMDFPIISADLAEAGS